MGWMCIAYISISGQSAGNVVGKSWAVVELMLAHDWLVTLRNPTMSPPLP